MKIVRILFLGLILIVQNSVYGQVDINTYKYVIIPESFSFSTENDAYQLNSLARFLFKKHGFNAFNISEGLPEDLKREGCKGLRADVLKKPGLFWTKLTVVLKDCNGVTVFTSSEGRSREKEFKKAYHEALRAAFKDVQKLNYKYTETAAPVAVTPTPVSPQATSTPIAPTNPVAAPVKQQVKVAASEVQNTAVSTELNYEFNGQLYLFRKQVFGYELVKDGTVIGKIVKTSRDNTFIVTAGDLSGNGYFDSFQNFTLERINPATNKLITDVFARQ